MKIYDNIIVNYLSKSKSIEGEVILVKFDKNGR